MAEEPGKKFELSNIVFAVDVVVIDGVADEVEPGDAETFFVDGAIEEGIIVAVLVGGEVGDADDGVVRVHGADFAKIEWEIAGDDDGVFAVGKFVIEIAAKIMVVSMVGDGGAHMIGFPVYVLKCIDFILA